MALYDVKNLKTGETKVLNLSLAKYEEWRENNPDWDKDWQAGVAASHEMFRWGGEAKSSGWNEVLDRASKQPGSTVRKNRDYSF